MALQFLEILLGQVKTVRMIDAHAGDSTGGNELEKQLVSRIEDFRQFHPDRGQIVDVEETAVINLLRRDPPEREPIRLVVQEGIERIETARIARDAIDLGDGLLDGRLYLRRFLATPLQPPLD